VCDPFLLDGVGLANSTARTPSTRRVGTRGRSHAVDGVVAQRVATVTPSTRPEDVIPAQIHAVEKQRVRKWYALEADADGEHKSSNVHGELELILEWCYNPELDFDPFCEEDKHPEKPPNEVCVGLGRGRHLAIKDKAVLYGEGSSDPRCTLRIDGTELKEVSAVKKTTLNPIWNETFAFPYSRGPDDSQPPSLVIECEDVDTVTASARIKPSRVVASTPSTRRSLDDDPTHWSLRAQVTAADFMGLVRIELDPLKDHKRLKKWLPLQARSDDKASSNISGDLEVFVRWWSVWKSTSASDALAPPQHRAGIMKMAWRSTRRCSTTAP
jgi:hypothetical protein